MRVVTRSRNARSCVTTIAAGMPAHELLDALDGVEVEVIGGLVEQQQVGRERERERQRRALALAARRGLGTHRLVEAEAMQVLDESRLGAPMLALVVPGLVAVDEPAAQREALAQRGRGRQHRLLLDQHRAQAVAALHLAVVELRRCRRAPRAATTCRCRCGR